MAEPRTRRAPLDPARLVAYDVLAAVRERDAYANLALAQHLRESRLSGRDAGFATELVSGTLRRRGTYDAVLAGLVSGGLDRLDAAVLDVLRLGCHQLLAMRVPTHAAVSSTAELARRRIGHGPVGLVNAVLRKVAAHDLDAWLRRVAPDPAGDPVGFASVVHSHPRWVVESLGQALREAGGGASGRASQLDDLLAADNARPKVVLVARPGRSDVEELVAAGGTPGAWSPYAVELAGGDPGSVPAVRELRAGVQDEGSQLVALALAAAIVEGRDERWLDACAGPGGKAALLAALAAERGATLLAAERQPHRAALVARVLTGGTRVAGSRVDGEPRRVPGTLGVVAADATRPPWPAGSFDRVLVDAPCSGLGALRRRPEARWRRTPEDLDVLVPLQRALLTSALESVRPGGVVLYATCSPVLAETAGVVSTVLEQQADVRMEDAAGLLPSLSSRPAPGPLAGTVQLWPHRHGTDAMFLALLRRG